MSLGRCLTDVVPHRLNESLSSRVGCSSSSSSNAINAINGRPQIIHQMVTRLSQDHFDSSERRRTFSSSYSPQLRQFPDYGHPLRNPSNVESEKKSESRSEEISLQDEDNSQSSSSTFSKEEKMGRSEEEFWKYGQPRRSEIVSSRRNYVVCYDNSMKIPVWVAENITYECLTGPAKRRHSRYLPDLTVRVKSRASNDDYRNSGSLSRGHMAAAANNKHCQDRTINSGPWNQLERLARQLTDHYDEVRIISGPLLLPSECNDGRVIISYELIGESHIVVPTHLFKVILAEGVRNHPKLSDDQRNPLLLAFVVPNSSEDLESSRADGLEKYLQLERFLTTLDLVEEKSGFEFFPRMDRNKVLQIDELGIILERTFI